MKKLLVVLLFFTFSAMASDKEDLQKEQQQLLQRRQQLAQAIQQIDLRLVEIQGVIKYLSKEVINVSNDSQDTLPSTSKD